VCQRGPAGRAEPGRPPSAELSALLVERSQLLAVTVGLLKVVADDLLILG
jgi:hypothetical protein